MAITFITGNAGKFSEARALLEGVDLIQENHDLPEIQSLDPREVMREKLRTAAALGIVPCIVEDSSLVLACLADKLPGPFIKWFEDVLGLEGLVELTCKYGDMRASVRTLVGYADAENAMRFFEGELPGMIVPPRGDKDFGYGPIFLPEGSDKTFGEQTREEKHAISSRGIAFRKLRDHLEDSR